MSARRNGYMQETETTPANIFVSSNGAATVLP